MLKVLVYLLTGGSALAGLAQPWVGVVLGYLVIILSPHTVWFWAFGGLRPFLYVVAPAFVGAAASIIVGKLSPVPLASRGNLLVALWWLFILISYFFGDFTHHPGPPRFFNADDVMSAMNKTFAFYFLACVAIRNDRAFRYLCLVIVVSVAYYVYWANRTYLSGEMGMYGTSGRLGGPFDLSGQGPYRDENYFGMLFVFGLPFLFYLGLYVRSTALRWALWAVVPFGWHAVFLTGSRGALLGLGVTLVLTAVRMRRRAYAFAVIPLFLLAYALQAGSIMKSRFDTVPDYQEDSSAESRITAWSAARRMIADHPLTGVGVASFGPAFPVYSRARPREAHNTFFQLSAESGIVAGGCWLLLVAGILRRGWRQPRRSLVSIEDGDDRFAACMSEATFVALGGYFVCAMFLSLQASEVFIYLVVIAQYLARRELGVQIPEREHKAAFGPFVKSLATRQLPR